MIKHHLLLGCAAGALLTVPAHAQTAGATPTGQATASPTTDVSTNPSPPNSDAQADASAQDTTDANGKRKARVEERDVVVTGSRFQKLLDAPESKSVINAEDRNLAGIGNIRTLIDTQPGLNYSDTFGLNVRGVGRQTPQTLLGQENTVIQYVDGFINLVPGNISESTLFGGNIQFLRGPAGTTYGRNALAGAVNLISRAPTKTYTGEVEAGFGRDGYTDVGANVAGPITSNLGFRVGIQEFNIPSTQVNLSGPTLDSKKPGFAQKNRYIEFQLEWRPGPFHIRNRLTTFEYDNQPGYPSQTQYRSNLPGGAPAAVFDGLNPNPQYGLQGPAPAQPYQISVNYAGYDRLRNNFQDIVNADLDLGFANFVYVGGYQQFTSDGSSDLDLTSRTSYNADTVAPGNFAPGTQVPTDLRANYLNNDHFWSQEGRLEGKAGRPLGWVLGFYYFNEHNNEYYNNTTFNATPALQTPVNGGTGFYPAGTTPPTNPNNINFEQRNIFNIRSEAVFGNVTYDFTPKVRFDGGLRYTWDQKDAVNTFRYVFYYPPFYAGDFTPNPNGASPRRNDRGLSGRAALAYQFNPGTQLYASYSRGYQSSAFTLGQGTATVPGVPLDPNNPLDIAKSEHLDVYELGGFATVKRLRFDASGFYENFYNQQIPIFSQLLTPITNPVTGVASTLASTFTRFVNAPKSEIYGAEFQATWRPTDHSNIVASYTYLHPTFKDFSGIVDITEGCSVTPVNGRCATNPLYQSPQNVSGNQIPRTPQNKATLYGYYGINLGGYGYLYPGGSVAYQSKFYTQPFDVDRFRVAGRAIVGFTLTYRTAGEHLDITGSVLNAFRHLYTDNGGIQIVGTTVANLTTYGQDRYWTVTARYRF